MEKLYVRGSELFL